MNLYSVADIARAVGAPARRVRYHCARLRLPMIGNTYVITEAERDDLCEAMARARPGPKPVHRLEAEHDRPTRP